MDKTVYHVTLFNTHTELWDLDSTFDSYQEALDKAKHLQEVFKGWLRYSSVGIQKCVTKSSIVRVVPIEDPVFS